MPYKNNELLIHMETIIICALIAVMLPFLAKMPLAFAMNKESRYDNNYPRQQQARLTGFGARALAAHENCFESLIIFTMAIAVVLATNTTGTTIQYLSIGYLIARVAYCLLYYVDLGTLRSIVWAVSLACPVAMIWFSIPAGH